jgi:hypothetical protein
MTLGDGIFYSAVLLIVFFTIHQLSVRAKWKSVTKISAVVVLAVAVLAGVGWGVYKYTDRPVVAEELDGVRLGMSPVDVKLAKGEPSDAGAAEKDDEGQFRMGWLFGDLSDDNAKTLMVLFYGKDANNLTADVVCERNGYSQVNGVGRYHAEKDVIARLGNPTDQSIDKQALRKMISFKSLKTAFEITAGSVSEVCISSSGSVTYREEYDPKKPLVANASTEK